MPTPDKDIQIQSMLSEIQLRTSDKPKPDSAEWWRQVAEGLGASHDLMRQRAEQAEQQRDAAQRQAELRLVLIEDVAKERDAAHAALTKQKPMLMELRRRMKAGNHAAVSVPYHDGGLTPSYFRFTLSDLDAALAASAPQEEK